MQNNNLLIRSLRWLWSTQKPILFTLALYLLVILAKNIAIKNLDSFEWYKNPAIDFLKLIEWMALIIFLLSIISKIPYIRVPIITLGMSVVMLIGVEATCLALYEKDHSPNAKTEQPVQENKENGIWKKLTALFKKENTENNVKPIPDMPPSEISAEALGVDVLPVNFEELKITGEPEFKSEAPLWHDWQQGDTLMGYVNKPNSKVEIKSWTYGIKNPVAYYTFDSLGRRVTGNTHIFPRNKYALFMGCSVAMGVLVDDKQTLPSIFERIDTTYKAYNYAVSGYGTHHLLALFQNRNLRNEIPEKEGIAFYIYFHGHVNRAIGDMDSYLSWNMDSPFYYLDGDKIVRRGSFKTGRKLISKFYEYFATTYICKYFDIHLPGKLRSHHYRFTAKLIEKSMIEYKQQFNNDNFYVVFLPGWGNEIKPYLEELKINYIDYDRLLLYWQDKYRFAGDGHPRPLLYKVMAEQLAKDIKSK